MYTLASLNVYAPVHTLYTSLQESISRGWCCRHTECVFTAEMADPVQAPKFEEHFWGPGNRGFDVLLQNYKVGIGASKELNEFIKER